MTTPHHQYRPEPSSPGATRAADVLTAAATSGRHASYIPYGDHQQQSSYHHHSTHQVPPPPTPSSSSYPSSLMHQYPQSHQQYTNTHALSPTLLENKPELPNTTNLLPPPLPLNNVATGIGRAHSQQQQQQQDLYHHHQQSIVSPPPVASTSAAAPAITSQKKIVDNTVKAAITASTPSTSLISTTSEAGKKSNSDDSSSNTKQSGKTGSGAGAGLRKRNHTISNSSSNTSTPPVDGATMNGDNTNNSGNNTASGSGAKKKPTRRYNASCDACRARKRKCPGRDLVTGKTLCTACADRGVECTYGNLGEPSRLRRADTENEKLRNIIQNALQAETADEKDDILATITERMLASSAPSHSTGKNRRSSEIPEDSPHGFASSANKRFKEDKDEDTNSVASTSAIGHSHPDSASHLKPTYLSHLSSQAHFNGTSAHGNEDGLNVTGVPSPRPSSDEETSAQFTQAVITNEQERGQGDSELERHVSYYLSMALPHGDFQDAPSPADDQRLLDFYFSWLNPRYALLSRKFFEQSRHVGDGVYCTPFLLWSLYAHSASHCPGFEQHQAYYRARAHILLTRELCKPKAATLPLAQGLILLAGTAAAKSDHSLAWTLSFTVTGMVIDLLETMDQSITENERMMRKRLYWSHYVWALVLALALNRKPCVPKLKVDLPLPDPSLDTEVWSAVLPVRGVNDPPQSLSLPRPGHELECFRETCQLFSFLDEILTNVYVAAHDKRSPDAINEAVLSIQERMAVWQSTKLSPNLLLNVHDLPGLCPPPHIIHFNLLLRAFWILLYRPFYNLGSRAKCPIKSARQSCNQYASEIYTIFIYLEENFGVLQLHFSFIYSAYWAATIDVASAKRDGLNPDLLARLSNSARILLTWISLPGMRQSVSDLIEQIEALLLADVPRQLPPATEAFSAYDPMHHPSATGQEVMMHNSTDAYFPQMGNMIRPHEEIMFNDPMMGVSAPVAYGPLGGLYWDSAAGPLW